MVSRSERGRAKEQMIMKIYWRGSDGKIQS
jgi:hypothetical protein